MGTAENIALVRRFYDEAWSAGRLDVCDDLFAEDYVRHDLRPTRARPGRAGMKAIVTAFRAAFPDLRMTIDLLFGSGDLVAARWTTTGTHTGAWGGRPPTGRAATFSGVNLYRFRGGRVVELWNHRDDLGLAEQLGVPVYAGAPPTDS